MKKKTLAETWSEALGSWSDLNDFLRNADEEDCEKLLQVELDGKARRQFVKRIHSRLNKARADREREELNKRLS